MNSFELSVYVVGNGSVTGSPVALAYANGYVITLTSTPDVGWVFWNWIGSVSGQQNPVNLTVYGNETATATFGLQGDINRDCGISLADLVLFAHAYGSRTGNANWNPQCDVAAQGVIDLVDSVGLAMHYGDHT